MNQTCTCLLHDGRRGMADNPIMSSNQPIAAEKDRDVTTHPGQFQGAIRRSPVQSVTRLRRDDVAGPGQSQDRTNPAPGREDASKTDRIGGSGGPIHTDAFASRCKQ